MNVLIHTQPKSPRITSNLTVSVAFTSPSARAAAPPPERPANAAPAPTAAPRAAAAAPVAASASSAGLRAATREGQRQQVNAATAGIGQPVVFAAGSSGQRTNNPDQVDIVNSMNTNIMRGVDQMVGLANRLAPNPQDQARVALEESLAGLLRRMETMRGLGMDTTAIEARIIRYEDRLEALLDDVLGDDE